MIERPPLPSVEWFNTLLAETRRVEYAMDCNRVRADCYLPLPPPAFDEEDIDVLMCEARRVHKNINIMGNDAYATKKEQARIRQHPALLKIAEILQHE